MSSKKLRVAIIGAGPSGTSCLRAFKSAQEKGQEIPEIGELYPTSAEQQGGTYGKVRRLDGENTSLTSTPISLTPPLPVSPYPWPPLKKSPQSASRRVRTGAVSGTTTGAPVSTSPGTRSTVPCTGTCGATGPRSAWSSLTTHSRR